MRQFHAMPKQRIRNNARWSAVATTIAALPAHHATTPRSVSPSVARTTLAGTMSAYRICIALHARANS
ncbi:hypothetical protein ABEB33_04035 [Herbaspirillum huttiense]|uniref:hypothetical protein n=1 Tax=Herbaspirillum huttiense TaxID=863372 RepID=UPI0038780C19